MAIFSTFFSRKCRPGKCFYDILERKHKNNKFNKMFFHLTIRVNPWFWSKNCHFSTSVFFGTVGQENVFYDIPQRKNAFLGYKKRKFKIRKIDIFSKGLPIVLVQKWPYFQLVFLGNIGQENVFYDILERKNPFLGYKDMKFNKSRH